MKELKKILLEFRFRNLSVISDKLLHVQGITPEQLVVRAQNIKRTKYKSMVENQAKTDEIIPVKLD